MARFKTIPASEIQPQHFGWALDGKVATVTIDRPARKNSLTFESYEEMRDLFHDLRHVDDVKAVVLRGAGDDFCSGADQNEIIGPLIEMEVDELLAFNRMAGDLVREMRHCPQPIVAAVDGVCVGAGAILAMAADLRFGTARARVGFVFAAVGLPGCDMGVCKLLPQIVGAGRAAELLYRARIISGGEAHHMGFFNELVDPADLHATAADVAREIANGPTFAHAITKRMLLQEWDMGFDEALDREGQTMAYAMRSGDFRRAHAAFVKKEKPVFKGN